MIRTRSRRSWDSCLFVLRMLALVGIACGSAQAAELTVCPSGCSFTTIQAAVDAATGGDVVKLRAGSLYRENVILRKKNISTYIEITSDAPPASLPPAGTRMNPSLYASYLPRIQSPGAGVPTIATDKGAHHYKLTYIDFPNVPGGFNQIVLIGDGLSELESDEPTDIVIDRCYFHGDPVAGQKRGVEMHGKRIDVINSYFERIVAVDDDSQCIAGWNGRGPHLIDNNYLECGTENIIFGGADPRERTYMRATGGATTTRADVATYEAGHTLAELRVGQTIAVMTNGGTRVEYTTIASISGPGATGTLTFATPLSAPPDVPGDLRAGVVTSGLTFRHNHVIKDIAWMQGVLGRPSSISASAATGTGSLPPGTYYYKTQAFSPNGYTGAWVNGGLSTEATATLSATGTITVTWTSVPGATVHRVWRGSTPGGQGQWTDSVSTTFADNNSASWTSATPFGATPWKIKNLFEFKALQDSQVDSNIFENHWKGSDIGYAIWLKSTNQDGECWWCQSKNVVIEKNIMRHEKGWLLMQGQESEHSPFPPPPMTAITIRNNLVYDSDSSDDVDAQYAMSISNSVTNAVIDHNTVVHTMHGLIAIEGANPNLSITNNMLRKEFYGIHSSDAAEGQASLAAHASGYAFHHNAVADVTSGYPPGNTYEPAAAWEAEFVAYTATGAPGTDYHIRSGSALHNAGSDGKDVGADIDAIATATQGVIAWTGIDIGVVGIAGSSSQSGDVWTIRGAGADIWDTADAFRFVYQALSGNGSVAARVDHVDNTNPFAKAGVMMRESTAANAAHVILDLRPTGDVEFMQRTVTGGSTSYLGGVVATAPVWLRLERNGSSVTASYSTDGVVWTTIGTTTATFAASITAGAAVTSHDTSVLNTSTFRGLSLLRRP